MTEVSEEQKKEWEEKLKNMSPEELDQLRKEQNIFYQIVQGKIPAKKVYEDDKCLAILDINPAAKGHVILFPKEPYVIMPQVPEEVLSHLFKITKKISHGLLRALKVSGTTIFIANGQVAGQIAQQFLIHIIPRREGDGLFKDKEKLISKDLQHKTKVAIEGKLKELLGISTEVVDTEEKEEVEVIKEPKPKKKVKKKAKKKKEEKEEDDTESEDSDSSAAPAEVEHLGELRDPIDDEDDNEGNPIEVEDDEEENDGDVSLDDIANLFT